MSTPPKPTDELFSDLVFSIAFAISRSSALPKSHRKIAIAEPVAKEVVEHLQRCGYLITKKVPGPAHGSFMPEKARDLDQS
jgi:hypothetical protein